VQTSGNGYTDGINVGQHIDIVLKKTDSVFTGSIESSFYIDIGNSNEFYIFHEAKDTGVVLSHIADPDYSNADRLQITSLTFKRIIHKCN
jgi:hypothetical protein